MLFSDFPVLENFARALDQCRVTRRGRLPISFSEGMSLACLELARARKQGRKAVLLGNGGSAAIASHQATDLGRNGALRAISFTDGALITCLGNDFGFEQAFAKAMELHGDPGDVAIAISSSGQSINVLEAVLAAKKKGIFVITLSGFAPENPLSGVGDLNFHVPSDSYGIVETAHLLLLHAVVERLASSQPEDRHESTRARGSLRPDASHPPG